MLGLAEIVEAARKELGDALLQNPVKVVCTGCGKFIVNVLVVPNLVRGRCDKCHIDVLTLVGRDRTVMSVTEKT